MAYGLVALVMLLIIPAGFIINDFFDVEKDKISHPGRPIPRGWVTPLQALTIAIFLFVGASAAALPLGWSVTGLVVANALLLAFYSSIRLMNGVFGNVITAYLCSSIVLLGGLIGQMTSVLIIPATFVFGLVLMREVVFDIHDVDGDRAAAMRTLPSVAGIDAAFSFAWAVVALLALGSVSVALSGLIEYRLIFLLFVLSGLSLITRGLWRYDRYRDEWGYRRFCLDGRWCFLIILPGLTAGAAG